MCSKKNAKSLQKFHGKRLFLVKDNGIAMQNHGFKKYIYEKKIKRVDPFNYICDVTNIIKNCVSKIIHMINFWVKNYFGP